MASLLTSSEVAEEKLQVYIIKTFSGRNQTYLNQIKVAALIFITWSLYIYSVGQSLRCVPEWASP